MGKTERKRVKNQFSIEIFLCNFEKFLKIVNFSSFLNMLSKFSRLKKRESYDFSNVKKYPPNPPGTPLPPSAPFCINYYYFLNVFSIRTSRILDFIQF